MIKQSQVSIKSMDSGYVQWKKEMMKKAVLKGKIVHINDKIVPVHDKIRDHNITLVLVWGFQIQQ